MSAAWEIILINVHREAGCFSYWAIDAQSRLALERTMKLLLQLLLVLRLNRKEVYFDTLPDAFLDVKIPTCVHK